jgi:hypothetical protein
MPWKIRYLDKKNNMIKRTELEGYVTGLCLQYISAGALAMETKESHLYRRSGGGVDWEIK